MLNIYLEKLCQEHEAELGLKQMERSIRIGRDASLRFGLCGYHSMDFRDSAISTFRSLGRIKKVISAVNSMVSPREYT